MHLAKIRQDVQEGKIYKVTIAWARERHSCSAKLCREIQRKLVQEELLVEVKTGRGSEFISTIETEKAS